MLPRGKRLSRASVSAVSAGKRAISAHFSISMRQTDLGQATVVVSKKVAQKAHDRNLVKRRVRAIIAPHVVPGRSFIVYARAGSSSLPYQMLKQEIEDLLQSFSRPLERYKV